MQKDVLPTHHGKDAFEFLGLDRSLVHQELLGASEQGRCLSVVGSFLQLRERKSHQTEQIVEAQWAVNSVEVFLFNGEAIHQHLHDVVGHLVRHFEAHHFAAHASFA